MIKNILKNIKNYFARKYQYLKHPDYDEIEKHDKKMHTKEYRRKKATVYKELMAVNNHREFFSILMKHYPQTIEPNTKSREYVENIDKKMKSDELERRCQLYKKSRLAQYMSTEKGRNMYINALAVSDAVNEFVADMSSSGEIHRFMDKEEALRMARTGKMTNVDKNGMVRGNKEFPTDGPNSKSFTMNLAHWMQKPDKLRITFRNKGELRIKVLRIHPLASERKTIKFGQKYDKSSPVQLELRLIIDEKMPPDVPKETILNIPPDVSISERELSELSVYRITREENVTDNRIMEWCS